MCCTCRRTCGMILVAGRMRRVLWLCGLLPARSPPKCMDLHSIRRTHSSSSNLQTRVSRLRRYALIIVVNIIVCYATTRAAWNTYIYTNTHYTDNVNNDYVKHCRDSLYRTIALYYLKLHYITSMQSKNHTVTSESHVTKSSVKISEYRIFFSHHHHRVCTDHILNVKHCTYFFRYAKVISTLLSEWLIFGRGVIGSSFASCGARK